MFARLLLACIVFTSLTAFAPAPLPRKERKAAPLSIQGLQGVWTVQSVHTTSQGNLLASSDDLAEIRVENTRWTFVYGRATGERRLGPTYDLTLDATHSPAWFNLTGSSKTTGVLRMKGGTLQILYKWGGDRPTSIDVPPDGYWFITFQRK